MSDSDGPENFQFYSYKRLIRRLSEIVDNEKLFANRKNLLEAIQLWVKEQADSRFDSQSLDISYQKWNRLLGNPSELARNLKPSHYAMMKEFLEAQGLEQAKHPDSVKVGNIENYMFFALQNFLNVGENTVENFLRRLPGEYRVYMKSSSMPDKYFLGKASLQKQNGALVVNIRLVNRNKPKNTKTLAFREIVYEFDGAAVYRSGNVVMVTRHASGNTLHTIYLDDRNLRGKNGVAIMKGSFTGALDDGCHARKILFERHEPKNADDQIEEDMLDKDEIPEIVCNYLDYPEST